jgi:SNF2 family DNA or RNA helicase
MMHIIDKFKNGTIKVILIDSYKFGAGIDLSFATDVILVHDMKDNGYQCIARAQRVGRTEPLKVHYVYYPHEIIAAN